MVPSARLFLLVLSLITLPALCQADNARLTGTVSDPQGRAIPGAKVRVEPTGGLPREARTDAAGRFAFGDLPGGAKAAVRAFADGFTADPVTIDLSSSGEVVVDVVLRVAAVSDAIVVSAAAVDTPLSTLPASSTVIQRADLSLLQAETVTDALRGVPGLGVATSGSRGALTSLFPRGGESDYTLVLMDGVRLNSFGGGFDAAHLPAAGVERVEVVRGPQSALFGAEAIGGVVQVITRRAGPPVGSALFEGGSYDSWRGGLDASGAVGAWTGHAAAQFQASAGLNGTSASDSTVVTNDDYTGRAFTGGGGWQGTRAEIRGVVHRFWNDRGNPGPFGSDPNGTFGGVDAIARGGNDQWTGGGSVAYTLGEGVRVRADASLADLDGTYTSAFGDSFTESRRTTGRGQVDWAARPGLSFSAGTEWLGERARSTYITDASSAVTPVRRTDLGTFGEARVELPGRLLVAAGVRGERIVRDTLPADAFGSRPALPEDVVVSWNPKLAVSWFLVAPTADGPTTRLRANAGTGIRAPDAFEIAFTDNPALEPERSRSVDVGVEQTIAGGRVVLDATWFSNRYDDLIVAIGRSFADASRYRTDNVSNARARGVELSGNWRAHAGVRVRGGYTWLDTEVLAVDGGDTAPSPFTVGDPLLRRPAHQGFVEASVVRDRVDAFARVTARTGWLDVDPSFGAFGGSVEAPGFAVMDAGGSWRPAARVPLSIFGRVTNLFDRAYEEVLGFPALGRSVIVGVRVAAGR